MANVEAQITALRLTQLAERPVPGHYDLAHLQEFHRRVFGDVYTWAGGLRTVAVAKHDLFALPQHIKPYLSEVLSGIGEERLLQGLELDVFVDRAAHYLAEINAVHPFREGNGRTQRAFIGQLALQAGYRISWMDLDPETNVTAFGQAHAGDPVPLRRMLGSVTTHAGRGALPTTHTPTRRPRTRSRTVTTGGPPRRPRRQLRGFVDPAERPPGVFCAGNARICLGRSYTVGGVMSCRTSIISAGIVDARRDVLVVAAFTAGD